MKIILGGIRVRQQRHIAALPSLALEDMIRFMTNLFFCMIKTSRNVKLNFSIEIFFVILIRNFTSVVFISFVYFHGGVIFI